MSILVFDHLDGEEIADRLALFVFLVSRVVERLFLTVPRGCLQFVIVVFPDHTHLLFLIILKVLKTIVK